MNRDRFAGAAESLAGHATSAVGTMIGSDRMVARGNTHRVTGKVRNVIGSIWDAIGLKSSPAGKNTASVRQVLEQAETTILGKGTIMNEDEFKGGLRDAKGKI